MKRKSSSAVSTVPAKQRKTGKGTAAKKSPVKTPKKAAPKTKKVQKKPPAKKVEKKKPVPRKKTQIKKKASPKKKGAKTASPKKKGGVKNASPKRKNPSPKKKNPTKKGQTGSKKATSTAKGAQKDGKKKPAVHPNDKLTPNLAIEIAKKDLMFEEKNGAGTLELSGLGKAKTAIQAVLTNNMPLLEKLIKNTKEVPTLFMPRSVDIADDALCTAMKMKNKVAVRLLLKELEDIKQGKARMTLGRPSLQKENTGRYNYRSLGHAVRAINVARGGREGNDAFMKDFRSYYVTPHIGTYCAMAAQIVDNIAALQPFLQSTQTGDQFKYDLLNRIWQFARSGSYKVTGALVKLAVESDGFGFNKLHQEVLTCSKPEELTRFRSVSVKKKPYDNQKITPLHLSAINPNPNMMLSLLAVVPEFYITDKNGYGLIHYAAACEGSGPLEALVSRGVFPNQATTMGLTPLMIASQLGRIQNMIFLLKPRKSIPLPGVMKEVRFVDSVMGSKTALHFAASNGQAEACKLLISNGANIEAITSAATNKLSPIMMASRSGHFKVVKTLVEAKASIDGKDKLKRTPLTHAVMNGHYIIASYLLRKGADPNSKDTSGNTPTHYAAGYGWWHCVKLLIKAGADPNIMNDWKVPPLCIAFLKGHSDCADVLIKEAGVGVDFRDAEGWTMVMMTLSNSVNEETLKQLKFLVEQKKADVKLQDGDGWNAMHHLASSPVNEREKDKKAKQFETVIECATILMKHGCDISAKTDSGETPVNIVMQQDPINTGLLQLLMNKGASISLEAGEDGENVLHLMARKVVHGDQCQVFDLLWKQSSKGATNQLIDLIDVQDKQGFTPLLRLAEVFCNETSGKCPSENFYLHVTALFKRFIQKGNANINYMIADDHKLAQPSQKERGAVIFHFIYPYCGAPISDTNGVRYKDNLLKAFASFKPDLNIRNKNGKTPLLQALEYGAVAKEAALILISPRVDVNMSSIPPGDKEDGQEENEAAEDGFQPVTPVILAAKNSLFSVVETLLLRGASASSPDNKSNLLHHLAALQSTPVEVIKCLGLVLNNGVDVNLCDGKKRTPLHYAVEALTPHSTTDVVEFLLEQGANVLAKDEEGRIPLHYAFCKLQNLDDYTQLDPIEVVTILTTAMKGRGIEMADKHGRTPLHVAAYRGATISFTHLIEYITDLDAADDIGNTPLSLAVAGGHDSIAVPLIQRGASINVQVSHVTDSYKKWAAEQKKQKEKTAWIWQKMKPPIPEKVTRVSLLYKVVEKGWQGVLYLLMDKLERFGLRKTAIVQATIEAGKLQLALSLIQKKMKNLSGQNLLNNDNQNMLHVLALSCNNTSTGEQLQVANALMALGNKPSVLDVYGCSALTYAILSRNIQLCKCFTDKEGGNVNRVLFTKDKERRICLSAFFYSSEWNESAEELWKQPMSSNQVLKMPDWSQVGSVQSPSLHHKFHIWKPPMVSQTPLMAAIRTSDFQFVKFLLKNGADVNKTDMTMQVSPLMVAVQANDVNIVKLLLNKEFNPDKQTQRMYAKNRTIGSFGTSVWQGKKTHNYGSNGMDDDSEGYSDDEDNSEDQDDEDEEEDDTKKETEDEFKMTSKIDFSQVDKDNRNVFHYLLLGNSEGTYENTDILKLLAKFAPSSLLTAQDGSGQSPLDLAASARADKLIAEMAKLTNQSVVRLEKVSHKWSDGIRWKSNHKSDFKADSEQMMKKISVATDQIETKKPKTKVDRRVGLTVGVEVVEDSNQQIPYSVLMTKVDVKHGSWGMNNFYKMQVIFQKGKDMYLLFTCWGRIGDDGMTQRTPFGSEADAVKEFCKIFAAKSGNAWANVKNFSSHPGKYHLVDAEPHASKKGVKAFNFDLQSNLPSALPQPLQDLLKQLTSVPMLNAVLKKVKVNTDLMPFGRLKSDVILEAQSILVKLRKLNEEVEHDVDNSKLTEVSSKKMNEILELSSKFYQLIPYSGFAHDKMEPLNTLKLLKDAEMDMQNLVDLELANRILLGAQHRIKEVNPLDYIYKALGCKIQQLEEDSPEAQIILQQIEQTREKTPITIEAIYHLAREGEEDALNKLKVGNHQLLWHGTKSSNLISIIKRGLLTQPIESAGTTGNLFGQGIYTSSMVCKSRNYCSNFYERAPSKFLLLCEVAVGKSQTDVSEEGFKKGFDSTLGEGQRGPDKNFNLRLKSGASIPLGRVSERTDTTSWLSYDEIVLYSEDQVCLRYLIQFK